MSSVLDILGSKKTWYPGGGKKAKMLRCVSGEKFPLEGEESLVVNLDVFVGSSADPVPGLLQTW